MKGFWEEAAGLKYVQVDPDEASTDTPVIIAIHGRGADATDLASLAQEIGPEQYRWILPQGPRPVNVGMGYMGWAWYELDEHQAETVVDSRDKLATFVDYVLAELNAPREKSIILGFSQGSVMAMHVGLSSEKPFAGVVVMSGHLPAAEALIPILPERRDRSVLMVHGTEDPTLTIDRGRRVREILEAGGLKPEYHEFRMGHQITPESLAVVRDYIVRTAPPAP